MPTDEKTPIASYNSAMASVKDAVAAANAASLEAARAKKRTADAATEAVNGSMVYVARKLLKHALGNCSREMYDNYESYHARACRHGKGGRSTGSTNFG